VFKPGVPYSVKLIFNPLLQLYVMDRFERLPRDKMPVLEKRLNKEIYGPLSRVHEVSEIEATDS